MTKSIISAMALTGLILVGCDDKSTTEKKNEDAVKTATNNANDAMDRAKAATNDAKDKAKDAVDAAKDQGTAAVDAAKTQAADATDMIKKQAQDLLDKANAYIKDNKWNEADGIVTQLESLKSKLPADWASKIDSLKSAVEKGKAAMNMIPGVK